MGYESEMNPYNGFKHHGIATTPKMAVIWAGDTFTVSIIQ
jgi:hypothetical protein